jgi:hypothetical protein
MPADGRRDLTRPLRVNEQFAMMQEHKASHPVSQETKASVEVSVLLGCDSASDYLVMQRDISEERRLQVHICESLKKTPTIKS